MSENIDQLNLQMLHNKIISIEKDLNNKIDKYFQELSDQFKKLVQEKNQIQEELKNYNVYIYDLVDKNEKASIILEKSKKNIEKLNAMVFNPYKARSKNIQKRSEKNGTNIQSESESNTNTNPGQ